MSVEHMSRYLRESGIAGEVIQLGRDVPTVEAAAQALGVAPDSIVKSVVFIAGATPVLVIASGSARIDTRRLADHLAVGKKRVRLADAATVLELTGFSAGSVPPFGHATRLRTLIDSRVMAQPVLYTGSGAAEAVVRVAPAEIARVTGAETVGLTDEVQQ